MLRSLLLLLALVGPAAFGQAAGPARWSALADLAFQRIPTETGVPNSLGPSAIAEDAQGFLWIGTQNGLVRFDGYRFRSYRASPKSANALPDAFVQRLHVDRRGQLWIGTLSMGLARYRADSDDFRRYPAGPQGLAHPNVTAIADAAGGGLWIGTDGGLDHLDPDGQRVTHRRIEVAGLRDERVTALLSEQQVAERTAALEQRTVELQDSERRLAEMAYSDMLTGLPNRRMFGELFEQLARLARRQGGGFALLLVDLDNFKRINDTLGHAAGDALLVAAAARLRGALRESDTVARVGGDEFALLLSGPQDEAQVAASCQRIVEAFVAPVPYETEQMATSPSIGVAFFPRDGTTADALYLAADAALYRAKAAGRNTWRCHEITPGALS